MLSVVFGKPETPRRHAIQRADGQAGGPKERRAFSHESTDKSSCQILMPLESSPESFLESRVELFLESVSSSRA